MEQKRNRRVFTCIASAIMAAFSGPLFWIAITARYPRAIRDPFKPLYFPAGILAFILVASLVLLIFNLRGLGIERRLREKLGEAIGKFTLITNKAFTTLVATVVYAFLWREIGFSISTMIFMALISKKLEPDRPWKQVIPVSIGTAVVVYILFSLVFKVPFPEPLLNPILDKLLY